MQSLQLSPIQQ